MVWNTPQSAMYQTERYFDKCAADEPCGVCSDGCADACEKTRNDVCSEARTDTCRRHSPPSKGLFDDGDMLLVFGVLLILMREKADQKLLFALLLAILM